MPSRNPASRNERADRTEADDAERLAVDLFALEALLLRLDALVQLRRVGHVLDRRDIAESAEHVARRQQQRRQHEFLHRIRIRAGRVEDDDAAFGVDARPARCSHRHRRAPQRAGWASRDRRVRTWLRSRIACGSEISVPTSKPSRGNRSRPRSAIWLKVRTLYMFYPVAGKGAYCRDTQRSGETACVANHLPVTLCRSWKRRRSRDLR